MNVISIAIIPAFIKAERNDIRELFDRLLRTKSNDYDIGFFTELAIIPVF